MPSKAHAPSRHPFVFFGFAFLSVFRFASRLCRNTSYPLVSFSLFLFFLCPTVVVLPRGSRAIVKRAPLVLGFSHFFRGEVELGRECTGLPVARLAGARSLLGGQFYFPFSFFFGSPTFDGILSCQPEYWVLSVLLPLRDGFLLFVAAHTVLLHVKDQSFLWEISPWPRNSPLPPCFFPNTSFSGVSGTTKPVANLFWPCFFLLFL